MTTDHTIETPARTEDATGLLPAPGGWVTTENLTRGTGRSDQDIEQLLRQAALDGRIVDGSLLKGGGPGAWHRPGHSTIADHTVVSGRVGSGKTTALRAFWAVEHTAPAVSSWVCDPTSSLDIATAACHDRSAAGTQASIALLAEARELISYRSTLGPFQAGADRPLVIVTVDDAHLLLGQDPRAVYLLEGIALLGRPLGVVPRVATADNTLTGMGSPLLWRTLNHPA